MSHTCKEILDLWDRLEEGFANLSEEDRVRVETEAYGAPRFEGFDGNNESDLNHIALLLVNDLGLASRFKGREMNSHWPSLDVHDRLLAVWRPMWDPKVKSGVYRLTADDLIKVLREKVHPENRQHEPGGAWTYRGAP